MKKIISLFIIMGLLGPLSANTLPIIEYASVNHPTIDDDGMVVSQRKIASEVGAQILKKGGNAIDAAVATGLALAVVLPRAGNFGGGGFMMFICDQSSKKRIAKIFKHQILENVKFSYKGSDVVINNF